MKGDAQHQVERQVQGTGSQRIPVSFEMGCWNENSSCSWHQVEGWVQESLSGSLSWKWHGNTCQRSFTDDQDES